MEVCKERRRYKIVIQEDGSMNTLGKWCVMEGQHEGSPGGGRSQMRRAWSAWLCVGWPRCYEVMKSCISKTLPPASYIFIIPPHNETCVTISILQTRKPKQKRPSDLPSDLPTGSRRTRFKPDNLTQHRHRYNHTKWLSSCLTAPSHV